MAVREKMIKQFLTTAIHDGVSASGNARYYNKNLVLINEELTDEVLDQAYHASVKFAGFYDNDLANVYMSVNSELEESVGDKDVK